MQKKLAIGILAVALLLTGCNDSTQEQNIPNNTPSQGTDLPGKVEDENQGKNTEENNQGTPALGKIHVGDDFSKVEELLGKDYTETFHEEPGHFTEAWYHREYSQGLTLVVGKDSNKVLEIDALSPDYPTNLGIKVGDTAEKVAQVYGEKYKLMESRHGDGQVEGFYMLEDGMVMIFDYNKDDDQLINTDIKPDSKVELIRLTKDEFLD